MKKFCSEILMLCNDLSTQPEECSRMKCPHGSKWESLSSPETCNMASVVDKTNITNAKDNQNDRK